MLLEIKFTKKIPSTFVKGTEFSFAGFQPSEVF